MTSIYRIEFSKGEKKEVLSFDIVDNDLTDMWKQQVVLLKSQPDCQIYRNQWIKLRATRERLSNLWYSMKVAVDRFNFISSNNIVMGSKPETDSETQKELNYLHLEFHKFVDACTKDSEEFELMDQLNMEIHQIEIMQRELAGNWIEQCAGFFFHSDSLNLVPNSARLQPIDDPKIYQFWDHDEQFGDLLLGYHTIGKSLFNCWIDNDVHAVKSGMVRPQITVGNEVVMSFRDTSYPGNAKRLLADMQGWVLDQGLDQYIDAWEPRHAIVGRPLLGRIRDSYTADDIDEVFKLGTITNAWLD